MENLIRYRHNAIKVNSLETFSAIRGGFRQNCRDVYFVRIIGWQEGLEQKIRCMDADMSKEMKNGKLFYKRIHTLPVLSSGEDTKYYTSCYEKWQRAPQNGIQTKADICRNYPKLAGQLGQACKEAADIYSRTRAAVSDSMRKNFIVKLLYWFDYVAEGMDCWDEKYLIKIAADNVVKEQEYLFYYFLTLAGCDVLLLQTREDVAGVKIRELSEEIQVGAFSAAEVPEFEESHVKETVRKENRTKALRAEKSFEELAMLSSSIVMIAVHDKKGEAFATGSGIMIGRDGYILTNDHVTRGGYSYSVRIENDDRVYRTDEMIKYHSVLDLALLRIDRRLEPIPVYKGSQKLVRGQAVAAIGSPLGLFNSVSNGIISGFRMLDGVNMIQFTAPISQGSSGGALLNMYGEVIGISTAGFDRGQNINLAVGYEDILMFIQGFQS